MDPVIEGPVIHRSKAFIDLKKPISVPFIPLLPETHALLDSGLVVLLSERVVLQVLRAGGKLGWEWIVSSSRRPFPLFWPEP